MLDQEYDDKDYDDDKKLRDAVVELKAAAVNRPLTLDENWD